MSLYELRPMVLEAKQSSKGGGGILRWYGRYLVRMRFCAFMMRFLAGVSSGWGDAE